MDALYLCFVLRFVSVDPKAMRSAAVVVVIYTGIEFVCIAPFARVHRGRVGTEDACVMVGESGAFNSDVPGPVSLPPLPASQTPIASLSSHPYRARHCLALLLPYFISYCASTITTTSSTFTTQRVAQTALTTTIHRHSYSDHGQWRILME